MASQFQFNDYTVWRSPAPLGSLPRRRNLNAAAAALSSEIPMDQNLQRVQVTGMQSTGLLTPDSFLLKQPKTAKRGVNSWMAFRSYYSKIFMSMQQKNTSPLLKTMWDEDPFKAKWSIVARAYTSIRDQVGKTNAPIEVFFQIVCPRIGIIGVGDYLVTMQWVVETDPNGYIFLRQNCRPDLNLFPSEIMSSNLTEKDVIHFCASLNYLSHADALAIAGQNAALGLLDFQQVPQQGIFASIPASQAPELAQDDPADIASQGPGGLGSEREEVQGEPFEYPQSDYYNIDEELFGLDEIQSDASCWDPYTIYDPNALDIPLEAPGDYPPPDGEQWNSFSGHH